MKQADERAAARGCWMDEDAAERVRIFFQRFLRHSKGQFAGKPFELLPWQWESVIRPLFGWKRPDGTRRFRRAYIEVPKKNGKSTLCAGLALFLLSKDGEPGAEVYSAAADRDQASIVFNEAANMVEASPALAVRCDVSKAAKRIVFPSTKSVYRALSADVPTKEGLNIHGLVFDELHAQKTRQLWDTLRYGGISRRQPLLVAITTAGYDKTTICWEQHCYAEGVLRGTIEDDEFFAFISAAGPDDKWTDPAVWAKANPSYGVTIPADSFTADCREAQQSPLAENSFRRYRLNQWTEQEVRWLQMDKWDACRTVVEPDVLLGAECYGGLDLSSTTDLSSFVLYFPEHKACLPFFWLPEDGLSWRARQSKVRVDPWTPKHITLTPGNVIDYDCIRQTINELASQYDLREIAVDPYNSTQIQTQLLSDGLNVVRFPQTYLGFTPACKELERLVLCSELVHLGNPVLRWMASNVVVRMDPAGNIKTDKSKAADRIDGIVALLMALGQALHAEEAKFDGKLTVFEV